MNLNAPIDHQTIVLVFSNALGFLLKETEGIIVQGEDNGHEMHKFLVFRFDNKIRVQLTDGLDLPPVGSKFWMHQTVEDTLIAAAESGEKFYIEDSELNYHQ